MNTRQRLSLYPPALSRRRPGVKIGHMSRSLGCILNMFLESGVWCHNPGPDRETTIWYRLVVFKVYIPLPCMYLRPCSPDHTPYTPSPKFFDPLHRHNEISHHHHPLSGLRNSPLHLSGSRLKQRCHSSMAIRPQDHQLPVQRPGNGRHVEPNQVL